MLFSLRIVPMPLLALFIFSLIWCLNVSSWSRCIPKCFWVDNWYTLVIFREKDYHLSLFWWIWIEGHFPFIGPKTNFIKIFISFCEVLIGLLTTENIKVSSVKSFTLASRLPDKSLIYFKKDNGPKKWTLRHTRFDCQILFHSEQHFAAFRMKKIRSKLEDHLSQPYILSYKQALHAILDQKL